MRKQLKTLKLREKELKKLLDVIRYDHTLMGHDPKGNWVPHNIFVRRVKKAINKRIDIGLQKRIQKKCKKLIREIDRK